MSVDLSAAIEAAAREHLMSVAQRNSYMLPLLWDDLNPVQQHAIREHVLPYVTAAAPLIEAAVRAQIAAEGVVVRVCGLSLIDQETQDERPELFAGMFAVEVTVPVEMSSTIRIGDLFNLGPVS